MARSVRHARRRTRHRVARVLAASSLALLLFAGTAVATAYHQLNNSPNRLDVTDLLNPQPSATATATDPAPDQFEGRALTILVIGTDSRQGEENSAAAGGDQTQSVLADTNIVAHLSADRKRLELVSIPRDSMVTIPECRTTNGTTIPQRFGMFNSAFAEGWKQGGDLASAVACDMNTVQANTGLDLDGYVLVQMGGFVKMVDALGGVDICIPEDIKSKAADLELSAGQQHLDGQTALNYARARKGTGLGDGSDLGRIERQQYLIGAVVSNLQSRNVLTDIPALYTFAQAALGSLTMSPNLGDLPALVGLARSASGIGLENLSTVMVPVADYPKQNGRVIWTADADKIWAALAADKPVAEALAPPPSTAEPATTEPTTDAPTTDAPSDGTPSGGTPSPDPAVCGS